MSAAVAEPPKTIDLVLSRDELRARAEREARAVLHVSSDEAFNMLDRGELHGTMAEAEFSMLRHLLTSKHR